MNVTLTLTAAANRLAMWSVQHANATRLMMTVMPMTLAIAAAVVLHNPHVVAHHYHIAPACGSGSGGGGGC